MMLGFRGIDNMRLLNASASSMNLPGFCMVILSEKTRSVGWAAAK